MHGQAVRGGWLDDDKAREVVELLLLHAKDDKPSIAISALDELIKIRALDIKEREVQLREQVADDKRRIALLTKLAAIDPGELARRAAAIGISPIASDGREGIAIKADGSQAGQSS